MKILKLKFKNINSLSGEHEIDFTQSVFTNEGLFAITGKTGAGKSSILDAISLALYGKTPRVEISGNENAVMTRGEKDCYSEITFEVNGKVWKSSWKQERTRTGNLKPVVRQISDSNNKIIADQLRACDTRIVEILGLTFDQFTKVILLAQGSFAAFLEANKNDKGELLEQITGTEIYGEISKKVFERSKAEKEKLDRVLLELEAIKILSDDEIKNLNDEIAALENEKTQLDEELQKIEHAKKWLSDLDSLQKQIDETKRKLPELEVKTITTKEAFDASENALKALKEEQKELEPLFKKVRELDTKISEKEKLLHPILTAISDLDKNLHELLQTLETQHSNLGKAEKLLEAKRKWASEHQKYEELVSTYAAIENEYRQLISSFKEIENLNAEITNLQKDLQSNEAALQQAAKVFTEKEKDLAAKTQELETGKTEYAAILDGKELSLLQSEKENISGLYNQIKNLIQVEQAIAANRKEIEDFAGKIRQLDSFIQELSKKIETDKITIDHLDRQINLLDENIKLTKTIQSLDELRQTLKDGEECPLCGALEHPFARGNVPQMGEKEIELETLKRQWQEISKAVQQNEKNLATYNSDRDNALKNRVKEEKYLSDNLEKQKEILAEIKSIQADFTIPDGENKIEKLKEILSQKQAELKQITATIERAINCEKQLIRLRDREIPVLQREKEAALKSKNESETAQKLAKQQLNDKQELAATAKDKYEKERASLLVKLQDYGVENMEGLKRCLDAWNENKKQTEELTNLIITLKSSIALNRKELENLEKSLTEKQNDKLSIETEKQLLSAQRKEIFGEKSVEEEENLLKRRIEAAETARVKTEKEKNEANTELEKNRAIVSEKENERAEKQALRITVKSFEELQAEGETGKRKADELSQKIGANRQTLLSNAENRKASLDKLKEKERQQAIFNQWAKLNELIGSSDGKKYRNFAQALTFEHLISLSNRQLQKMSERYLLKRSGDSTNPFELSVIDKFQNSEERTAQNLSGGEKFIVSLSLALGLANMAGRNMRIDTMFIDEGFGTLDSDYLDVALNALSNLQSEGKIIGIISHLTELKERISTHIEVVPLGNGHSRIQITN
ncbi:MAG: Nuclease SbcCD subunit C [Bacteroidetes bacterium ADurb.BinA261]|jgi:exonuclease SbcC|nr:MAG: Nuclease SbcCD subunit C [Bacteroidetes bacterium ADurb.BinA261]